MAENKRYYWLQLHDDFFDSRRIKKLRKLGADYVIIYLKLQLKSLNKGGIIEYLGIEDSLAKELELEIDEDADKIQLTLSYLQSCGLLVPNDDTEFILPFVEICTGSETASTRRSQKSRAKKMLQCNTDATPMQQLATNCNGEKEIEIEKDIDIYIEPQSEEKKPKKEKPHKKSYGEFNHVLLTENEYENIANTYGWEMRDKAIKFLDEYIEEKPKYKSASHNLAIRRWVINAVNEQESRSQQTNKSNNKNGFNNYNQRQYDYDALERQLLGNTEGDK